MPNVFTQPGDRVPRWLVLLGSLVIGFHLTSVVFGALAAPSGPWPTPDGRDTFTRPQFAFSAYRAVGLDYLSGLKLANNYHFPGTRPGLLGVYLEIRLKDEKGQPIATLHFPEDNVNTWVRHGQAVMARGLTDDQPIAPPMTETVAPPNQQVRTVPIWDIVENNHLRLKEVPEHLIPRDRPVQQPSEVVLLLTRSVTRYLCRTHGAASAEVIRHTQVPISPAVLFMDNVQPGAFDELISNFGELPR
jgi:hypothetical protein